MTLIELLLSACRQDRGSSLEVSSSRRSSTAGYLQELEVDPDDIVVLRQRDGSLWKLGEGGFGTVSPNFINHLDLRKLIVGVFGFISAEN